MDLEDCWAVGRRWWWLIVLGVAIGAGGGLALARHTRPTYRASALLIVNQTQPSLSTASDVQTSENLAQTFDELLSSRSVLVDTIHQLRLTLTPEALAAHVDISAPRNTQLLQVSVTEPDPRSAATLANALAHTFIGRVQTLQTAGAQAILAQVNQNITALLGQMEAVSTHLDALPPSPRAAARRALLQSQLTAYNGQLSRLLDTQQQTRVAAAQVTSVLSVFDPATPPPASTTSTRPAVLLGAIIGLILAVSIALLRESMDDRIRDSGELGRRLGLTPLATLGRLRPAGTLDAAPPSQDTQASDGLHLLHVRLQAVAGHPPTVLCITSAVGAEGKSTVAAHLAVVAARAGRRVALVDADLRDPSLHRIFGLANVVGTSTILAQNSPTLQLPLQQGPRGIAILVGGPVPSNPVALLDSAHMGELIARLRAEVDLVIVDTPPLLSAPDALMVQGYVDGTVLVVNTRCTGMRTLERALAALQQAATRTLGVVLTTGVEAWSPPARAVAPADAVTFP